MCAAEWDGGEVRWTEEAARGSEGAVADMADRQTNSSGWLQSVGARLEWGTRADGRSGSKLRYVQRVYRAASTC